MDLISLSQPFVVGQDHQDVDATLMSPWELINSAGDGSGGHEKVAAELDAVGFNYSEANYESLRLKHPNWLIYGSETSSATRTRGSYYHPEREWVGSNQEDRQYEQSDYGNDRVGWVRTATASWTFDRDHAGYAGQFIWTGTDYIGEPTMAQPK